MIKDMVWSYSRLAAFAQCKYQFYLKYIVADDDQYLSEGNYYAEVGSFVHSILEMVFKNQLSVDEAGRYFAEHFDDNVFYKTRKNLMDKRYEACANYFADLDLGWLKDCEILGIEKQIDVCVDGYRFTGFIDLLVRDKVTGNIILIDHKSSKVPVSKTGKLLKASEASFTSYKHQMYLYALYVKQEYGEYPAYIAWNHFADGGEIVSLPFSEKEMSDAKEWFLSTIHDIEEEESFEETRDFFYCHNLCDFRNSCEYNKTDSGG